LNPVLCVGVKLTFLRLGQHGPPSPRRILHRASSLDQSRASAPTCLRRRRRIRLQIDDFPAVDRWIVVPAGHHPPLPGHFRGSLFVRPSGPASNEEEQVVSGEVAKLLHLSVFLAAYKTRRFRRYSRNATHCLSPSFFGLHHVIALLRFSVATAPEPIIRVAAFYP
jgi:hypothetical protein